jgi:hypothetical protein
LVFATAIMRWHFVVVIEFCCLYVVRFCVCNFYWVCFKLLLLLNMGPAAMWCNIMPSYTTSHWLQLFVCPVKWKWCSSCILRYEKRVLPADRRVSKFARWIIQSLRHICSVLSTQQVSVSVRVAFSSVRGTRGLAGWLPALRHHHLFLSNVSQKIMNKPSWN